MLIRPRAQPTGAAVLAAVLIAVAVTAPSAASAHGRAHQHGVAALEVVADGSRLTLTLDSPLDNLLGFERAPRTEAERRRVQSMAERLRAPATLIRPDGAARCTPGDTTIEAPVVGLGSGSTGKDGHADLSATWVFTCAEPSALAGLDLAGLFAVAGGLRRLDVQMVVPAGQRKRTLTPAASKLDLR
jgi:hypothetical protein